MSTASFPFVRASTTDQEINWWVKFYVAGEKGPYVNITDYLHDPDAVIKLLDALPVGWEVSRTLNIHRQYRVGGNGFAGYGNDFCRAACLALLYRNGIQTIYDYAGTRAADPARPTQSPSP